MERLTIDEQRKCWQYLEAAKIVTPNKQQHRVTALDKVQMSFEDLWQQKKREKYFMEHGNKK